MSAEAQEAKNAAEAEILKTAPEKYPRLLWHDEFDGTKLDPAKWSVIPSDLRPTGVPNWRQYTSEREGLVTITDGCLVLKGIVNPEKDADPRPYLQGQVWTKDKFSYQYGKIEIRAKFEDQKGAWPAFWMLPQGGKWPDGGEIDIMERLNGDAFVYQTCHSAWTVKKKQGQNPPQGGKAAIKQGEFNVYGFEWTEKELIWSVNGKNTFTYPRTDADPTQWPYTTPFYLLLDMQLEGSWVGKADPATLPVSLYIDWVRVWAAPEAK